MKIAVKLNGFDTTWEIEPHEFLLDVLRRNGCPSVKRGCDTSSCGVCTVLLDGAPVLSCSLFAAKAEGHSITTVEGLSNEVAEFAECMTGEGADQCGYCNPGLALTVLALKRDQTLSHPTEDEIKNYLIGNLCRCTGYVGQLRAIKKFLGVSEG
jgi:aerobic carbon-monoxide dehydrogenase small subunit